MSDLTDASFQEFLGRLPKVVSLLACGSLPGCWGFGPDEPGLPLTYLAYPRPQKAKDPVDGVADLTRQQLVNVSSAIDRQVGCALEAVAAAAAEQGAGDTLADTLQVGCRTNSQAGASWWEMRECRCTVASKMRTCASVGTACRLCVCLAALCNVAAP